MDCKGLASTGRATLHRRPHPQVTSGLRRRHTGQVSLPHPASDRLVGGARASASATPSTRQLEYLPNLSRRDNNFWAPFFAKATGLIKLGEGHWCLSQDFWLTENIYLHSHIVELRNGDLMMISPPSFTEEARALLDSIPGGGGRRVRHVMLPSLFPEHVYGAPEWAPYIAPDAILWAVPGLLEQRAIAGLFSGPAKLEALRASFPGPRLRVLPENGSLTDELAGQVETATLPLFSETTVHLVDYKAVLFTDGAFAAIEHPPAPIPGDKYTKTAAGLYGRLGCPASYLALRTDPEAGRRWVERVLSWRAERVLSGHLDPVVPNADMELRRCFDFLLTGNPPPEQLSAQ